MRVPIVVALSGGLLLSGLSGTAQARPTPSPSPVKVQTNSFPHYDSPEQANFMMGLTIIIPLLIIGFLVCIPIVLILCWLISLDTSTIDKRK